MLIATSVVLGGSGSFALAESACAADKRVVAACFVQHGMLSIWADLRIRIWPIGGTKHVYEINIDEMERIDPPLPANVSKVLDLDRRVYGDFTICPFSRERPRHMQYGCIESAQHLVIKEIELRVKH